jgi:hypothetical protein
MHLFLLLTSIYPFGFRSSPRWALKYVGTIQKIGRRCDPYGDASVYRRVGKNCPFLIFIIMLLCVSKLTLVQLYKCHPNLKGHENVTANITSSTAAVLLETSTNAKVKSLSPLLPLNVLLIIVAGFLALHPSSTVPEVTSILFD